MEGENTPVNTNSPPDLESADLQQTLSVMMKAIQSLQLQLQQSPRHHPIRDLQFDARTPPKGEEEFKLNELPDFDGSLDPEVYLEWERSIECMF